MSYSMICRINFSALISVERAIKAKKMLIHPKGRERRNFWKLGRLRIEPVGTYRMQGTIVTWRCLVNGPNRNDCKGVCESKFLQPHPQLKDVYSWNCEFLWKTKDILLRLRYFKYYFCFCTLMKSEEKYKNVYEK